VKAMKISYDPEVDVLSITFRETTVTTKHLAEGTAADYPPRRTKGRLHFRSRKRHSHQPSQRSFRKR